MRLLTAKERKTFSPPGSPALVSILAGGGQEHGGLEKHTVAVVKLPAGKSLEMHFHKHREESYLIVAGTGLATVDDKKITLKVGDLLTVWPGEHHALSAYAAGALEYVVVTAPAWAVEDVHPCC